jgi:hypothetical protein
VILRNYEGYITTYEEPTEYTPHDSASCTYCRNPRPEPGQEGITGLLDGRRMWIEPAGFEQVHDRGATDTHRLKDPSKWVPYGVGAIEGRSSEAERGLPVLEAAAAGSEANGGSGVDPKRVYGPGEEPRPADGEPTGTANHELL